VRYFGRAATSAPRIFSDSRMEAISPHHAGLQGWRGLVARAHQGPRVPVINRIITCITGRKPEPAPAPKMPDG
jgi:hypothetical protein